MLAPIEKNILASAQQGNISSFENLVSHYEKAIYNYVFKTIQQRQEAEDITQDVFIKVYKHLSRINLDANFTAWIYKIATNTTFDYLRKKKRKPEAFIIDDPESNFETIDNTLAYEELERIQDSEQLSKAMEGIRPEYKSTLLLYYYQDFSYEEIAEILRLPLNTVKTFLHRARRDLKEKFTILYPNQ